MSSRSRRRSSARAATSGDGSWCRCTAPAAWSSFTVIRIPPRGRLPEAPYAVAVVKLDEGVSLLGRIDGIPLDALTAGLSVRFRPLLFDDQVIIGFGPA